LVGGVNHNPSRLDVKSGLFITSLESMLRMKKKFLSLCTYFLYLAVCIVAVDYACYRFYIAKVMPKADSRLVDTVIGNMGVGEKKSSFSNFSKVKPDRVIRIGCLGDSFTYGCEVNDSFDYPTLLQTIFRQHGYSNVEVINFGMPGRGFHEVFNIWKFFAREYRLDYVVILGPACFQSVRDATFAGHTVNTIKEAISRMHARYILKNKALELVDVEGDTFARKVKNYLKFIPPERYLLYDRRPPAFLAAPVYCLFPGRELKANPFYYRRDLEGEMLVIYRMLLDEMSNAATQVILCHYQNEILNAAESLGKNNLLGMPIHPVGHFPYQAGFGHHSSNANLLLAQQLFDCLTGKTQSSLTIVRTIDLPKGPAPEMQTKKVRLSAYKDISIEMDSVEIGRFYDQRWRGKWSEYCEGPQCRSIVDTFARTASLVALNDSNASIFDRVFLSLDFEIEEGMPVMARIRCGGKVKDIFLAPLALLHPGLNMGEIDIGPASFDSDNMLLEVQDSAFGREEGFSGPGDITVFLHNTPILSARLIPGKKKLKFQAVNGSILKIKADGNKILDVSTLGETGLMSIFFAGQQQESSLRVPLAQWFKTNEKVFFKRRIAQPVSQ
jgi:hypothetical protein